MTDFLKHMPDEAVALHQRAKELLAVDPTEEDFIAEMVKEGITENYAKLILNNILSDKQNKRDFYKMLLMGLFTVSGALLLNYMSYNFAFRNGAAFMLVFWGLVVGGIIMLIHSIGIYRRLPRY